jgi:hypothetical protein
MSSNSRLTIPQATDIDAPALVRATTWVDVVAAYRNTAESNDLLFTAFTQRTLNDPLLAKHREYIEKGALGFGDPAFHMMWKLLVDDLTSKGVPRLLEIGVYKGQVISLWALLLKTSDRSGEIFAISPMQGTPMPVSPLKRRLMTILSAKFRERVRNGDFYEEVDYLATMHDLFRHFGLDPEVVRLIKGLSTDAAVRTAVSTLAFDLIYIDGDHTYDVVRSDLDFYTDRIRIGGYLVTDDSGLGLPGSGFWKGHPSVSQAVRDWENARFRNVLNCGHNRVFQRVA